MPPETDPGYVRLLLLVGGIASDVKNVLLRQDGQDDRITRLEDRIVKEQDVIIVRLRALEAFRWKMYGMAVVIPTLIAVGLILLKETLYG